VEWKKSFDLKTFLAIKEHGYWEIFRRLARWAARSLN